MYYNLKMLVSFKKRVFLMAGLVYLVGAVSSPLFGFIIDKTGRNITWVVAALAGKDQHCSDGR